ncbi:PorV/PorQ family protein [Roseivirga sp. 4D4]|uniref:putative type IX sorting system protein PorV2 n=1 Tax=Roseivirga sp. 4D4 TaxID=1889784 RepID=UPI000ACFED8B|nr:PorV/PorQ family protein [Roseivirga sp. 4D4]
MRSLFRVFWGALLIPILFHPFDTLAQTTPKYSNEFLSIGVGARALGMSNAMTSVVDDVTAAYWNPAALTDIEYRYQFAFQHAAYFAGVANYDYVGAAMAIDTDSHLGLAIIRLGIDDIPDTRLLFDDQGRIDYSRIQFFSTSDVAFILSYARGVSFIGGEDFVEGGGLTFGTSFKVIRRKIGAFATAWGFGLDLSAKYRFNDWDFGLMIRDISTTFNAWSIDKEALRSSFSQTNNSLPSNTLELTLPKMIFGASRTFTLSDKISMLASADLVFTFDGRRNVLVSSKLSSLDPQMGFEFGYENKFFLRMGFGNFQRVKDFSTGDASSESTFWSFQPNMGMGVKLDDFTIDYALTDIGNVAESPYSHVFSIRYSLEALPGIYARNKRRVKKREAKDEN